MFYRVLFHYFDEFVAEYENRFEREYGYFRPVIQEVVKKYLDCGGEMKVISLFSFELAILNVLHSFQDFSKQKLRIKSRILLHVKKGNYSKSLRGTKC